MNIQEQIASLLAERAEIDAELEKVRLQAIQELDAAKANVEALEAVLQPLKPRVEHKPSPAAPIDETDAGRGIRETEDNTSATSFVEELAALREHTQEKRRRLQ